MLDSSLTRVFGQGRRAADPSDRMKKGEKMAEVDMQKLFEAGAHFGHQTQRWNPKMAPFIFTQKNKVHIIDLAQTVGKLEEAKKFIEKTIGDGGKVLFVGTKKQAQGIIQEEAEKCGMPYVAERWLGGMLTNFQTIASRTRYLRNLEEKLAGDSGMIKKERLKSEEELKKLKANLGGILELTKVPNAIFVVDVQKEMTAIKEARKMGLPIVAITDTNVNPELVDYPIPANDDAVKTIKIICEYLADAIKATPVKNVPKDEKQPEIKVKEEKGEIEAAERLEEKDEVEEKEIKEDVKKERK